MEVEWYCVGGMNAVFFFKRQRHTFLGSPFCSCWGLRSKLCAHRSTWVVILDCQDCSKTSFRTYGFDDLFDSDRKVGTTSRTSWLFGENLCCQEGRDEYQCGSVLVRKNEIKMLAKNKNRKKRLDMLQKEGDFEDPLAMYSHVHMDARKETEADHQMVQTEG